MLDFEALTTYISDTAPQWTRILDPAVKTYPIPYFGDISTATVLTVGVNPAISEFRPERLWPLRMTPDALRQRVTDYFRFPAAIPHPWFNVWSEALAHLGVAYPEGTAAHTDLSPRPTLNMGEADPDEFLAMITQDFGWFVRALREARICRLLLIAGSVTKRWYINELVGKLGKPYGISLSPAFRRQDSPGLAKVAFQHLKGPGLDLPVFFCSVSPSARNADMLVGRVGEHRRRLGSLMVRESR